MVSLGGTLEEREENVLRRELGRDGTRQHISVLARAGSFYTVVAEVSSGICCKCYRKYHESTENMAGSRCADHAVTSITPKAVTSVPLWLPVVSSASCLFCGLVAIWR